MAKLGSFVLGRDKLGDSGSSSGGGPVVLPEDVIAYGQITLCCVVDAAEIHRYYRLALSTATKPAKPVIYPPDSFWTETEPAYTEGSTNNLYTVECAVYADGTFSYSEVSLSSSYEAAKQAYNKAVSAGNMASDAKDTADAAATMASLLGDKVTTLDGRVTEHQTAITQNAEQIGLRATKKEVEAIRVGGRNLIRNSQDMIYKGYYFGDAPVHIDPKLDAPVIKLVMDKLTAPVIELASSKLTAPVIELAEEAT